MKTSCSNLPYYTPAKSVGRNVLFSGAGMGTLCGDVEIGFFRPSLSEMGSGMQKRGYRMALPSSQLQTLKAPRVKTFSNLSLWKPSAFLKQSKPCSGLVLTKQAIKIMGHRRSITS
jgi:hypothetical protein